MSPRRYRVVAIAAAGLVSLTACGEAALDAPAESSSPGGETTTVPAGVTTPAESTPAGTTPVTDPAGETDSTVTLPPEPTPGDVEPTEVARIDLADRLDVDPASIEVGEIERVTWRDGSLGCPDPDRSYTQALVDGYRVELRVGDAAYWYHGADGGLPFYCADPRDPAPVGAGDR